MLSEITGPHLARMSQIPRDGWKLPIWCSFLDQNPNSLQHGFEKQTLTELLTHPLNGSNYQEKSNPMGKDRVLGPGAPSQLAQVRRRVRSLCPFGRHRVSESHYCRERILNPLWDLGGLFQWPHFLQSCLSPGLPILAFGTPFYLVELSLAPPPADATPHHSLSSLIYLSACPPPSPSSVFLASPHWTGTISPGLAGIHSSLHSSKLRLQHPTQWSASVLNGRQIKERRQRFEKGLAPVTVPLKFTC